MSNRLSFTSKHRREKQLQQANRNNNTGNISITTPLSSSPDTINYATNTNATLVTSCAISNHNNNANTSGTSSTTNTSSIIINNINITPLSALASLFPL